MQKTPGSSPKTPLQKKKKVVRGERYQERLPSQVVVAVVVVVVVVAVAAHAFNPSTWKAEAEGFLSSRPAWSTE